MKNATAAASTTAAIAGSIQKLVNWDECDDNNFSSKIKSVIRTLEKQKGARKICKIAENNDVVVITKFYQRSLSNVSENKINEVIFNYHKHNVTLKNTMLFEGHFKLIQSSYVRNKKRQKVWDENMIIDFERGPHALLPNYESWAIFGCDYVDPAKLFLTSSFGMKKNKDEHQIVGYCQYNLAKNCRWYLIFVGAFYIMCADVNEEFNFYIGTSVDPNSK